VIKHHPEPGLETDFEGKDTWRMVQAGADQVVLAAPDQIVHRKLTPYEHSLREIAAAIKDVDLILTEGYKREDAPKIEISRGTEKLPLLSPFEQLVGVATDQQLDLSVPQYGLDDAIGLANLIESKFPLD
jgi:molybdopterin-guanine dinucleotide biosynthesis protein MobB